jgi:hypothetical protein
VDFGHPVAGLALGQAGGKRGSEYGVACASPVCEPAVVVVFEWPTAPDTLPVASQPLAYPVGTGSSSER